MGGGVVVVIAADARSHGTVAVLPAEKGDDSFDAMIGAEDNTLYGTHSGRIEMHVVEGATTPYVNARATWMLHRLPFCHPLPECIYGDVIITAQNNEPLDRVTANMIKQFFL